MKKLLPLLAAGVLVGCMSTTGNKVETSGKPAVDLAAEAKIADKLPLVSPESVTPQNYTAKVRELEAELTRDARRVDAARSVAEK